MESSSNSQGAAVIVADPLLAKLKAEPHRAFAPEALARLFNPKLAKDPEKLAEAAKEITSKLEKLVEAEQISEVEPGHYKFQLFFDAHQLIGHAFTGGMDHAVYSFEGPIFRLNIGVLSLYFMKDTKKGDWLVTVRDSTIGKDYCVLQRPTDGTYIIGSQAPAESEKNRFHILGRYIDKKHLTLTISGEKIRVEDNRTLEGTRIDHLTEKGLGEYQGLAKDFLTKEKGPEQKSSVKRGLYVLDHFKQHHQNIETTFFSIVVDSLLV